MNNRKQPTYRKYQDKIERKAKVFEQLHRRSVKENAYLNTVAEEDLEYSGEFDDAMFLDEQNQG